MNDLKYAIPAALFFCTLAVLLFTHGTHLVQSTIASSLFIGALGQFIAQDQMPVSQVVALMLSYFAIFLAAVALVVWSL